jgi:thioredoxin-like negative regulator of GroEL
MKKKLSKKIMSNTNTLIVYYRQGCHLCEQMMVSLSQQQTKHQAKVKFSIKIVDIDDDPKLLQKYNVDVPVAMYQNEVIFYHFFDAEEFERTLKKMKK